MSAHTSGMEWAASPSPSVWRKRVALEGPQESGRVTSVVRHYLHACSVLTVALDDRPHKKCGSNRFLTLYIRVPALFWHLFPWYVEVQQ